MLLLGLLFVSAFMVSAADAVTPGKLVVERPTLICLGFEWQIAGDDNRNATVHVTYRMPGEITWKAAMPLLRLGGEKVFRKDLGLDYTVPDMFSGSILDLLPATEYEVRFAMQDPEGVRGEAVHVLRAKTRGEPTAAQDGRILHVYSPNWNGEKREPSFTGLKQA